MKKILLLILVISLTNSCKKDEKISESTNTKTDSIHLPTDTAFADSAATITAANNSPRIKPLNEGADLGKVIFTQNELVMIVFNTQSQTGKIVIDGKEYALNKLTFAENNYEITGNGVKILAEDGNFKDMTSDCLYGNFPKVKIMLNQQEINLENINIQDCPAY